MNRLVPTFFILCLAAILMPRLFSKTPIPTPKDGPVQPSFFEPILKPKFNFEYRKKGPHGSPNSIEAKVAESSVVFDVKSGSGIGSGSIKLKEGNWPKKVLVRLHLRGLEGFSVSNGKKTIQRSDLNVRMLDPEGNLLEGKYLLKNKGYYEAIVPSSLLGPEVREIQIRWVDFYRG